MIVNITCIQREYLANVILKDRNLLTKISDIKDIKFQKYSLDITVDDADEIRDLCCERLDIFGFDEDYELTKEGELLEELIDIFYIGES